MSASNINVSSNRNQSIASKTTISLSVSQSVQDFKLDHSKKPKIPYRYFVSFAGAASLFLIFSTRSALSVAMVAMVRKDGLEEIKGDNSTIIEPMWKKKTYPFTDNEQGIMLASYYYSYTAFQFIAGIISDKVDPVWLNIVQHGLSAGLTFITPFALDLGIWAFVAVRILLGTVHSTVFSSLMALYRPWFPPSELPVTICFMSLGASLGMAFVMYYTAWISETLSLGGWPMAFYSLGAFEALLPIVFFFFITKSPQTNRFVGEYEKKLIAMENVGIEETKNKVTIHWRKIFKSPTVWAIVLAKAGISFGFSITVLKIPHYFEEICKMNLKDNGLVNLLIYILAPVFQLGSVFLAKYFITHEVFSCTVVRKIFETISLLLPATMFILITLVGENKTIIVILVILMMCFLSCNSGGDMPIIAEMAPDISATIFGICNTMSSAMGFGAPMMVGFLLNSDMDRKTAWNITFNVGAIFMIFAAIIFNLFAVALPQTWGLAESRYKKALSATLGKRHFDNQFQHHQAIPRLSVAV